MFKRAIKSNHWMAIGLEKWNDIENMEITPEMIKKMRKYQRASSDSEDEDENPSSDQESVGTPEAAIHSDSNEPEDSASERSPEAEEEASASSESEEDHGNFEFCPICPGRKFLTEKDAEAHRNSAKHQKRERALENANKPQEEVAVKESTKKEKKPKSEPKPAVLPAPNNRKARRAQLADSRTSQ